ncbi:MAG: carboxypeptidase regulatory-like domain-containing protein [Vicinamibacteria bacterium]
MKRLIGLALALLLAFAPAAFAQVSAGGNIYGTVLDESGAVLPGVSITVTGETGTRTAVTGPQGAFRFLNLNSGRYTVAASLTGFATVTRAVQVTTGENVEFTLSLKVSGVQESIQVTGETPLVDTKKRGTSTTMTSDELQLVPNARDPWAVLKAVPGVLVDRVNIAGNENGQQANSAAKGTGSADRMWNLDGIVITDMSATGASPTYFDFDAFQEIGVTTGGADLSTQGGGMSINMTTKRGTNKFHGGARGFLAHDDFGFGNVPSEMAQDPRLKNPDGSYRDRADHIQQIADYGFDIGGPILKDKLWFYGTWGKQDIRLTRLNGTPDKTLMPSYNVKVNWQAAANTMVSGFYFLGAKQKFGRDPGFGVTPTASFAWDQDNEFMDGGLPGGLWKMQIDHTFSPNFLVSAKGAYYDTGFSLTPHGGLGDSWTLDYVRGEGLGSSPQYLAVRPQKNVTIDGNYFFEGMGAQNELKFGFSWRDYKTVSGYELGGNQLQGYLESDTGCAPGAAHCGEVEIGRSEPYEYTGRYWSAYIGDVLSKDRFTLNVGVRWDLQTAINSAATVSANASFPAVMPDLVYDGNTNNMIEWTTWSPRVGMSYALNESRKSILRASYARYGNLLSFGDVSEINPISWGAKAYEWNDFNGDKFAQPNEVNLNNFLYSYGVNLANPGSATPSNRIDQDYKSPTLDEFVVGLDHEVGPNFAVGAAYTYRKGSDYASRLRLGSVCDLETATLSSCRTLGPGDYTANNPVTANGFTARTYSPIAALVAAGGGGRIRTNREGYSTSFNGVELTLTKRLSNRWMSRVAFSFNDWTEDFEGTATQFNGSPGRVETDPLVSGGQVALLSGGSGKASFYSSVKWQVYANALYQGPLGLDFSTAIFGRQGGPYPIDVRLSAGQDGTVNALATPEVDTNRYDNLWNIDLRLAKTFKLGGGTGLTLSAEWFNVMNTDLVLSRYRYANSSAFVDGAGGASSGLGRIEEVISPSIFRFGARFSF